MKKITFEFEENEELIVLYNKTKRKAYNLGNQPKEIAEKLEDFIGDNTDLVVNYIGSGMCYSTSEMEALTTDQIQSLIDVLKRKLEERDN